MYSLSRQYKIEKNNLNMPTPIKFLWLFLLRKIFSSEMKVELKNMDSGEQKEYLLSDIL